jgi:hypothetical protein
MPKQKKKTQKKKGSRATRKKDNTHPYWYFDAAVVFAGMGESDTAFSFLEKALGQGFRECSWLRTHEFKLLQKDKRWPTILKKCKGNMEAFLKSVNLELYRMYKRDGADQQAKGLHRKVVERRNMSRLKRVRKMLEADEIKKADDFYHASSILYNGPDSSDYKLARQLALKAVRLNPKHYDAKAQAAMCKDRYLHSIGKPQIYGTQFKIKKGKLTLEPFDRNAVTQRQREEWCISHLCWMLRGIERIDKSNK